MFLDAAYKIKRDLQLFKPNFLIFLQVTKNSDFYFQKLHNIGFFMTFEIKHFFL